MAATVGRPVQRGERTPLYFWRDQRGTEVDLLVDFGQHCLPIEIKAGETVTPSFFSGLEAYARLSGRPGGLLVYGGDRFTGRGEFGVWPWWGCS